MLRRIVDRGKLTNEEANALQASAGVAELAETVATVGAVLAERLDSLAHTIADGREMAAALEATLIAGFSKIENTLRGMLPR
jgi:hypothetical protein